MSESTERIYLDYNATTPVHPEVAAAMQHALGELFGNPSSSHWAGRPAKAAVDAARGQVATLLGCQPSEVLFTSGGSEANNYVIQGAYFANREKHARPHLVTSQIEHPAVLQPCAFVESLGAEITRVPVDRFGRVDPEDVRQALRPETVLVTIMHVNNEVGTLEPIREISEIARERGVLMHTDAAQSVGKIEVNVEVLGVDLLSVAGHKLYGPKGVGALYIRQGVKLPSLIHGAGHETGRRAGTENVAGVVGLGRACQLAAGHKADTSLRDTFWQRFQEALGTGVVLNGHPEERLPNTLNVSFLGYAGGEILAQLPHVAASTGSACHAGEKAYSAVLTAMGANQDVQRGAVRFSLGRETTAEEIETVVDDLRKVISRGGGLYPATSALQGER